MSARKVYTRPGPAATQPLRLHVNLDERGEFFADVRRGDETIFDIHGSDIFADGWMRHSRDTEGLSEYLFHIGITEQQEPIQ